MNMHDLTRSLPRIAPENEKDCRNPGSIRGNSKLVGGDFVVILDNERVCSLCRSFLEEGGAGFINVLRDTSFLDFHLE